VAIWTREKVGLKAKGSFTERPSMADAVEREEQRRFGARLRGVSDLK
jgi:hypothetical protein